MNILVLCDRYPYPLAHGLTLRVYNVLCRLAKRHTLDLLCYGEGPPPGALTGLFRRIETFTKPQTSSKHAAPWVRLRQAFSLDHLHAVQPAMAHRIHELVESEDYALVLAYPNVLHYFASGLNIPLVVDLIDDHLLMYWRHLRVVHSPFEGLRLCKRWLMMYRFERRLAKVAKAIVVVSEADRDFMARFCQGAPLHVIPNGVNGDYYRPLGLEEEPYTLVFEGKMDFAPNVDGVRFFCQTVLPLVHRQLPQARLWVVGKDPTPEVLALAGERVTVTGFVDDVRPYLDRASLFVCPLRMGGGIKNKILQAWAMGKAVVATPVSVGGLRVEEGVNLYVRDGPRAFADAVVELLTNRAKASALGQAARQTVVDHYTWERVAELLDEVMGDAVAP